MPLYAPPVSTAAWVPADNTLLAAVGDPRIDRDTQIATAGTLYLIGLNIRSAITITNLWWIVTTAGNNTGGSTGTFAGLYSSAGTLLSGSADVAATIATTGAKELALTTPQAVPAGSFVWAALLTNLGTTQPTLAKSSAGSNALNLGLAAAAFRVAVNGTGLTALPSPSITPASNTATGSFAFWAGVS